MTRIVGRGQGFSGHSIGKALRSTQSPSSQSAAFKSLIAFLRRTIRPVSISILPWAANRLSIAACLAGLGSVANRETFIEACPSYKLCPPQKPLDSRPLSVDASYAYAYGQLL